MTIFQIPFFHLQDLGQNIFLVTEKNSEYRIADLYIRYQEYFECPNPAIRGQAFTLKDFKKWYQETKGKDTFTYATDFTGFNIPSIVISEVITKGILDPNKYDTIMKFIFKKLISINSGNFCLIGYKKGWDFALPHEIAHALYFLNPDYREEMQNCLYTLTALQRGKICQILRNHLYGEQVLDDELQAYLSAEIVANDWLSHLRIYGLNKKRLLFRKVFEKYAVVCLQSYQKIAA